MATVRVPALAKINLTLKVLSKRPDHYHELRTVFQTISLSDAIEIECTRARSTNLQAQCEPPIPDNIVIKAAAAVLDELRLKAHVRFRIHKKIPMGGGLGGGSTNAAAALLALPALLGKSIAMDRLTAIAASIGSDVPFFLLGGTALGLSRGEELYPFPEPDLSHGLLVTPDIHVSTPKAFHALNRHLTDASDSRIINNFQSFSWELGEGLLSASWQAFAQNDFEQVVFQQHPQIQRCRKKLLTAGARLARMTGSGSAVFGFFDNALTARQAQEAFPHVRSVVFRTVSRARYRSLWWRSLAAHARKNTWPPQSRYAE